MCGRIESSLYTYSRQPNIRDTRSVASQKIIVIACVDYHYAAKKFRNSRFYFLSQIPTIIF